MPCQLFISRAATCDLFVRARVFTFECYFVILRSSVKCRVLWKIGIVFTVCLVQNMYAQSGLRFVCFLRHAATQQMIRSHVLLLPVRG
jgi:hypothetical protein